MIDTLLALVPTYGVWLILASVALSCLALPIPSSMLVMAAGGFAAAGDLVYWQLVAFSYAGFVGGDQVAYHIGRKGGTPLLLHFKSRDKTRPIVTSAEQLVQRRGMIAVFLSRTILSPLGPYVGYLSGALQLRWWPFTLTAAVGAVVWCIGYSYLGYTFASQIDQIAAMISSSVGIVMAAALAVGSLWWVYTSWRRSEAR